jgi:hypothetical protein
VRYWAQYRAPAGNWVDSIGTDNQERAIEHARYLVKSTDAEDARVIERVDTQVWPFDQRSTR